MHSTKAFVKYQLDMAGVTLTEIASRSGEDIRTVSHVIAGKRTNRAEVVLKEICKATGLKYGDLIRMYGLGHSAAA